MKANDQGHPKSAFAPRGWLVLATGQYRAMLLRQAGRASAGCAAFEFGEKRCLETLKSKIETVVRTVWS
jgi:hypothetical protein